MKNVNLIALLVVGLIAGTGFGAGAGVDYTIEIPAPSGSGGGGGSVPAPSSSGGGSGSGPDTPGGSGGGGSSVPMEMHQGFDVGDVRVDVYAGNNGNSTWLNAFGRVWQGEDQFYEVERIGTSFYTLGYDTSLFEFSAEIRLKVLDEMPGSIAEMSQGSRLDAFGVDFETHAEVRPHSEWIFDEFTGEGEIIITNDIDFDFNLGLEPAAIDDISLWVDELDWKWTDHYDIVHYEHELNLFFYGEGHFLGENAEEIGGLFVADAPPSAPTPPSVPEPVSMILFGLGSLVAVTRRKRS